MSTIISKGKNFYQKLKTRFVILLSIAITAISIILILAAVRWENDILRTIGASGLSAGIVSLAIEVFLMDISSKAIKEEFKDEIKTLNVDISKITSNTNLLSPKIDNLKQSLDSFSTDETLIKGCNEAQIKSVSLNRMASEELKKSIMECMVDSKEIKMLGATLRQFFTKDRELKENLLLCAKRDDVSVKILVCNPFTNCVVKRTLLEQGKDFESECKENPLHYRISETYVDVNDTLITYKREFKKLKNVKLKCYNDFPSMWVIITDTCAFFQPYQYGRIEETLCIGESFVIIRFGRGHAYDLLSRHYEYVWNDKSNLELDEMLKKYDSDEDILRKVMKGEGIYWRD